MENRKRKATSVDVAKLAGISQTTVSRAFNNPDSVSRQTLNKINEAARHLNYTPNYLAQSLTLQQTNLIGVIIKDFENPFYTSFVYKVMQKMSALGKNLVFFDGSKGRPIEDVLREADSFRVNGLIIASSTLSEQLTEKKIPTKIPVVMINRQIAGESYCSVASDDIESGRFAADFFVSKGFRSFAFISGPPETTSSEHRQRGYVNRLQEWGYFSTRVELGDYTYESGYAAMKRIVDSDPAVPMAVLCANDLMGLGAVDAIRRDGRYKIPYDFSLIGYDNIIESTWKSYQLSSMTLPIDEMIQTAVEYLNTYYGKNCTLGGKHLFPCKLVERETTF